MPLMRLSHALIVTGIVFASIAQAAADPVLLAEQMLKDLPTRKLTGVEKTVEEARLLYYVARYTPESQEDLARSRYERASAKIKEAQAVAPDHPGVLFWWTAIEAKSILLQSKFKALKLLPEFEKALLAARAKDPAYLSHGPDRALGSMYHGAPGFISIGSDSKARVHLEAAYKAAPRYPGNGFALAEFLHDEGEKDRAVALAREALALPELAKYPLERFEWEDVSHKVLKK